MIDGPKIDPFDWKTVLAVGAVIVVWYSIIRRDALDAVEAVGEGIADPDNPVNSAANSVFATVSGNHVDTIGTWLYDVLHPDAGKAITAPTPIDITGG